MHDCIYVKDGSRLLRIFFHEILYFEGGDKATILVTATKQYKMKYSLQRIEKTLPAYLFCRIHRSYIICLKHLTSFNTTHAYADNKQVPIGRQYKNILHSKVRVYDDGLSKFPEQSHFDLFHFFKKVGNNLNILF